MFHRGNKYIWKYNYPPIEVYPSYEYHGYTDWWRYRIGEARCHAKEVKKGVVSEGSVDDIQTYVS